MFARHPLTMVSKIFLATFAGAAAAAAFTTAAASPALPSTRISLPSTVNLASDLKNALVSMQSAARNVGLPCSLTSVDHVFADDASKGHPKSRAIVRMKIMLKYGKTVRTLDLRSSCYRATMASPVTCSKLWMADWPAFCAPHGMSHLCTDQVPVRGRETHVFLAALLPVPHVCDGLPSFTSPPPESPVGENSPGGSPIDETGIIDGHL